MPSITPKYINVTGAFPNKGINWSDFTVSQINENLLYFINLITDYTNMELKDDLTIDEGYSCDTYGNIYFIGFKNRDYAEFCVYRTRRNEGNMYFAFDIADRNHSINYPNYDRNPYGGYEGGFLFDFHTDNVNNVFGVAILISDNIYILSDIEENSNGNISEVYVNLNRYRVSSVEKQMVFLNKTDYSYRFRQYSNNCYLLSPYGYPSYMFYCRVTKDSMRNLVDDSKNYIVNRPYFWNNDISLQFYMPSEIVIVFLYNHVKSSEFGCGNIIKIDDTYYVCIYSYGSDAIICMELGTSFNFES